MRRYAESTEVPIERSRREITELMQQWGCKQIAWADDFERGRAALEFVWRHEGQDYHARFAIELPSDELLRQAAVRKGAWRGSPPLAAKLERLRAARGRPEHRQMLLWLKAAFNAVRAGIIRAEALFLPWLVMRDGRTVGERAIQNLPMITAGGGVLMLMQGEGGR